MKMSTTNPKVTLKVLQYKLNDFKEELNVVKEELNDVKKELNDARKGLTDTETMEVKGGLPRGSYINRSQTQSFKVTPKQILKCRVWDKSFESSKALKMHLIRYHAQKVKCKKSDETFVRNCDLEEHMVAKHGRVESYDCDICEKQQNKKKLHTAQKITALHSQWS